MPPTRQIRRDPVRQTPSPIQNEAARKVATFDPELQVIAQQIDSLRQKTDLVEAEKKKFKLATDVLVKEIGELETTLLEAAKRRGEKELQGSTADIEIRGRTSNELTPKGFAQFLKKIGQSSLVWNYLKVGVTQVIKDFGERALESEGVLTKTTEEYASIKLVRRG